VVVNRATSVGLSERVNRDDDVDPLAGGWLKSALPNVSRRIIRQPIFCAQARDVRASIAANAVTQRVERVEIHHRVWIGERRDERFRSHAGKAASHERRLASDWNFARNVSTQHAVRRRQRQNVFVRGYISGIIARGRPNRRRTPPTIVSVVVSIRCLALHDALARAAVFEIPERIPPRDVRIVRKGEKKSCRRARRRRRPPGCAGRVRARESFRRWRGLGR